MKGTTSRKARRGGAGWPAANRGALAVGRGFSMTGWLEGWFAPQAADLAMSAVAVGLSACVPACRPTKAAGCFVEARQGAGRAIREFPRVFEEA